MFKRLTKIERSWVLYDVANSAFSLILATILPIYSNALATAAGYTANQATAVWSYIISISTAVFVVLGPILGAFADNKGNKKRLFTAFMLVGAAACLLMGFVTGWILFLALLFIAKLGFNGSVVFYDGMLTDVAADDRMDEVSSLGFAYGYIGSCIPFLAGMAFVLLSTTGTIALAQDTACAIAIAICAVWWGGLSIPLIRDFKQRFFVEVSGNQIRQTFRRIGGTVGRIRKNKPVLVFLLAFFFYIDGVYTIIEIATPYGISMGISTNNLLLALLLTQIVAFPFAILFGRLAGRFSVRKLLQAAVFAYFCITVFAFQLDKAWEFWMLAGFVGMFQGGIQALSRSYYAKMVPKENANEYFGFYDIFGKSASIIGTFLMGLVTQLSDKPNLGVIPIALMFVLGFAILALVPKNAADGAPV